MNNINITDNYSNSGGDGDITINIGNNTEFDEKKLGKLISKRLSKLMEERGENQQELAESLGVTQSAVSCWCRGIRIPKTHALEKIAEHYNLKVSDIIGVSQINSLSEESVKRSLDFVIKLAVLTEDNFKQVSDFINYIYEKQLKEG